MSTDESCVEIIVEAGSTRGSSGYGDPDPAAEVQWAQACLLASEDLGALENYQLLPRMPEISSP